MRAPRTLQKSSLMWCGSQARVWRVGRLWLSKPTAGTASPGVNRERRTQVMRKIILPAALALLAGAASFSSPVQAEGLETGGVSITRGGGNVNAAVGRNS